jgi:dolichol-phosphate mannosyltransferase
MPELSVIVPVTNEGGAIPSLIEHLHESLDDIDWEVVLVNDDSSDETRQTCQALAQGDRHVRCLWRVKRNGLSGAVSEGVCSSSAPYFAVLADFGRDDERALPDMLKRLKSDRLDIVIGKHPNGNGLERHGLVERVAKQMGRGVIRADLADPSSGFFVMRRDAFDGAVMRLSEIGFGILLDLFASSPRPLSYLEMPVPERRNQSAEQDQGASLAWELATLTLDKTIGRIVPTRFLLFGLVGGFGVFVHLAALWCGLALLRLAFVAAQTIATIVAMTSNFLLNNVLTFRDQRLRGAHAVKGLLSFYLVCGVGVIGNVGVANFIYEQQPVWWLAGAAGTVVGAVWNFAASSVFTWRKAT